MARQPRPKQTVDTVETIEPTSKPIASSEVIYLMTIVDKFRASLDASTLAKIYQLNLANIFACEGERIPLTELLKSVATSGLQSEIDVKQLKNILSGDTGLLKTGKLLHNVQVSKWLDTLYIIGGRNRTILLFCLCVLLTEHTGKDCVKTLAVPCQVLSYSSQDDLFSAIVAANQSRKMSTSEVTLTLASSKLQSLDIPSICGNVLTEREYKSATSMLLRKLLSEKYGDSLTIINYSLGLKTARDSKFFLEYISKLLPKLSNVADKKTKLIDASKLTSVLNNLMAEISELDAVKADKFLSYLNQNDRELPSGLVLPLCCYPIALFRVAGLEEIARNLTKTGLTGLDGLAPLAVSIIASQYGEKGLLKNSEAIITTASSEAVSTIDISVFDF